MSEETDTAKQLTMTIQQAIDLGMEHHKAGRLPEAENVYHQIIQADPNQPDALHLLGVIAHQVGKHSIAVDLIAKALSIKPDYAEAHNNLGNAFKELGRLDEAVVSYHKALAIEPDYTDAHYNLGISLKEQGELEEAVISFYKALAIRPDYAEAHSNLGNALTSLGKLNKAVDSFRDALAIKPDYAEAHSNLGIALTSLGRLDEAVASHHRALAIKPDFAEAHCNLGIALTSLGRLDEAVASHHKALAIKPNSAEDHSNLGNALKDLDRLDEAVASYQAALAIKPDFAEALDNLGGVLTNQGKLDEAIAAYDKVIALQPDYVDVHCRRSLIYRFIPGDPEIDRLRSLVKQDGLTDLQRAQLLSALGLACDQIGLYDNAFSYFREANRTMVRERPFDAQIYRDWVAAVKEFYASEPIPAPAPSGKHIPIFVLGMSRSGKTLTESLLAQADHVFRTGESQGWLQMVNSTCQRFGIDGEFPEYLTQISDYQAGAIGAAYLERNLNIAPTARFSVNTSPIHCWSLGLILQAIPYARIVYCQRNPMDCCLRNFIRWYGRGQSHSNDLADIAVYFKIYREIMEFWVERFGDRILQLHYEGMVKDPNETARVLFDFCGLEGDHKTVVADFTTDDIGYWRNYEPYLTPLHDALVRLVPEVMHEDGVS